MSSRPTLVFVGGFLGAGKTTLIFAAAHELERRGLRAAVILNDQGQSLVDTQLAQSRGLAAGEVTGGCFCCRFSALMKVADALEVHNPDVILAEPVGSCTDISATTLQPIRSMFPVYQLAPFTILVDPARARQLLGPDAESDLAYLFRKQLEEADLVCFTKSDLYPVAPELPDTSSRQVSATTGQGVAGWLDELLSGKLTAGGRVLEIDYQRYARAEASLAWLNLEATLDLEIPRSPAMLLGPFLDRLDQSLTGASIAIVHLKVTDDSSEGFLKAALCMNGEEPAVEGALDASPANRHHLLVNLRAAGPPERVRNVVESELRRLGGDLSNLSVACFQPAAPRPEHRFTSVCESPVEHLI
jgi:Ni2+-binding GTPase involved in maturation of urease and hydrogenase